jgi:SAM-dependent methyltransferase
VRTGERGVSRDVRDLLGLRVVRRLRRLRRPAPRGLLLRRGPVSRNWGFDRGAPIDRYFIQDFLARHRALIAGRVLEVKDNSYTQEFGCGVTAADVVDIDPTNPQATVVADLTHAPHIPDDSYDCILLTQVLHLIYDVRSAMSECRRILTSGGTLLATAPAVSRCSRELHHSDYWRMTPTGASRLFAEVFGSDHVEVDGPGNAVLSAAFLMGVAAEEISPQLLLRHDPLFPLVVTILARKQ